MSDLFDQQHRPSKTKQADYTAHDIEVLEGLEPVRRRPGMYIGGTDENALHHLVAEVFDNAMDEAVAGHASYIEIRLNADGSITIIDNGRGIPVDPHPKYPKKSALEVILTTLHSGGKFNNKVYYTSGGLHGVGISVVNALSDILTITVVRGSHLYTQTYSRGNPTSKLQKESVTKRESGTSVTFHPDPEIFGDKARFKPSRLYNLAKSKAYLYKGVEIRWRCDASLLPADSAIPGSEDIHFPGGLKDFLNTTLHNNETLTIEPFAGEVSFDDRHSRVEWAVHWAPGYDSTIHSYCNTVPTPLGGTHETGFRTALVRALKSFGELTGNKRASVITIDDVLNGVVGILSLFIHEPQFQGQTKEKLSNKDVVRLVENAVKDHFDHWLSGNKQEALKLLGFIIERAEERINRKQQKDISRKSATQRLRLPGKLADCTRQTPEGTEIFLVEGDSAGGSAKMARMRETQAVLPLRGKILNVASATMDKIRANQEIADMNLAFGCGVGEHYKEENLRYEKIIIMTDADVDGAHIATLLMTYFFTFTPQLITQGHLYLARPPLFRITQGSNSYYAASEKEKDDISKKLSKNKGTIDMTRFKGLGEMTPGQLKETTMNPATRTLLKVIIDDKNSDAVTLRVSELMGKKPELRFKFITEQSELLSKALTEVLDI